MQWTCLHEAPPHHRWCKKQLLILDVIPALSSRTSEQCMTCTVVNIWIETKPFKNIFLTHWPFLVWKTFFDPLQILRTVDLVNCIDWFYRCGRRNAIQSKRSVSILIKCSLTFSLTAKAKWEHIWHLSAKTCDSSMLSSKISQRCKQTFHKSTLRHYKNTPHFMCINAFGQSEV